MMRRVAKGDLKLSKALEIMADGVFVGGTHAAMRLDRKIYAKSDAPINARAKFPVIISAYTHTSNPVLSPTRPS